MKIIVGLVEHIGDVIACEPVVRYLKKKYPRSEISWVVNKKYRILIDSNPYVDHTIPVSCLTEWIIHSRHDDYDLVVDLHVNHRICQHCKVPLVKTKGNPFVNIHEWFDYGSILEAFSVGADLPKLSAAPVMYIPESVKEDVKKFNLGEQYCVIHRTSSTSEKDWDDVKWKLLVKWLTSACKLRVVEIGNGASASTFGFPFSYKNLVNKTSLMETAEIIRGAKLFVGVDSGPAHMANACRTPGIVLLGRYSNFKKYNPFTGLYSKDSTSSRILRNLNGPASEIPLQEVQEAGDYILKYSGQRELLPTSQLPPDDEYPDLGSTTATVNKTDVQVLAFYLPQFHPIYENDGAHGAGFTEWTNVIKTKPLFSGHYQPKQPGELGYYDLRSVDVIRKQVELAVSHGVTGFCFYYYYFAGKKLLYKPIQNFIDSDIDFPFCFMWANENWSKRWDGGDKEVIIEQIHSDQDDRIFINNLKEVFADRRYIKVEGKPVLIIYKAHLFDNIKATIENWRDEAEKMGLPGLYLIMADDWSTDYTIPRSLGFDASYEIPSNLVDHPAMFVDDISAYNVREDFKGLLVDYFKFSSNVSSRPFPEYKRFKTVMAPWDNTARYGNQARIYVNTSNDSYRTWMTKAYLDTYSQYSPDERFLFVHSWNEWCEGTYIEPDAKYGRRYLQETLDGVTDAKAIIEYHKLTGLDLKSASLIRKIDRRTEGHIYHVLKSSHLNSFGRTSIRDILVTIYRALPPGIQGKIKFAWRKWKRRHV